MTFTRYNGTLQTTILDRTRLLGRSLVRIRALHLNNCFLSCQCPHPRSIDPSLASSSSLAVCPSAVMLFSRATMIFFLMIVPWSARFFGCRPLLWVLTTIISSPTTPAASTAETTTWPFGHNWFCFSRKSINLVQKINLVLLYSPSR